MYVLKHSLNKHWVAEAEQPRRFTYILEWAEQYLDKETAQAHAEMYEYPVNMGDMLKKPHKCP